MQAVLLTVLLTTLPTSANDAVNRKLETVRPSGVGRGFSGLQISRCVCGGRTRPAKPRTLVLSLINEPLASNVLFLISRETERRRSWRSLIDERRYHCRRHGGTLKSVAELAVNYCCGTALGFLV